MKRILFTLCVASFLCFIGYSIFLPLYTSSHVIIDYGINPFNICTEQPLLWRYCKYWFVFTYIFSSFFIANFTFHLLFQFLFPSSKTSCKRGKPIAKKKKLSYSLIEQPPPAQKLELLIRRSRKNKGINLFARKKFISKYPNHRNYWNRKN